MKGLCLVVPIYNEAASLDSFLQGIKTEILDRVQGSCVICVDDGSTDHSGALLDAAAKADPRILVVHQKNGGHGNAVLSGYRRALTSGCEWIFNLDSDDQIPADNFSALWSERQRSPFILAVRRNRQDPAYRLVISVLMRAAIRAVLGVSLRDPNVPFRLMKADLLNALLSDLYFEPFAPNLILSSMAVGRGFDPLDIPVPHRERAAGQSALKFISWGRIAFRCVKDLFRARRLIQGARGQ